MTVRITHVRVHIDEARLERQTGPMFRSFHRSLGVAHTVNPVSSDAQEAIKAFLKQGDGGKKAAVVLDFHDRIGLRPGAAPWREAAGGDGRPGR